MTNDMRGYLQRGHPIERRCAAMAAKQLGLITRLQLTELGLTPRAIDYRHSTGALVRCLPGVYRYPAVPVTWQQRLLAACLWAPGVASHRSAGAAWRLAGIETSVIEITAAKALRCRKGVVVHRSTDLPAGDRGRLRSLPVTSPLRTILDLASVLEVEDLELALDDALHRRLTTLPNLVGRLERTEARGRKGLGSLKDIVSDMGTTPHVPTKLERLLASVLQHPDLPVFHKEHRVNHAGRVVARIDFAYPEHKVGIEADSFRWHSSPAAFRRDRERSNSLTQLGWRIHRATWWDARDRSSEVRAATANLLGLMPMSG